MKKLLLISLLMVLSIGAWAQFQFSQSPLRWWRGYDSALTRALIPATFPGIEEDQDRCYIDGKQYTYWLYSGSNDGFPLFGQTIMMFWFTNCLGYTQVGDNDFYYPNHDLAQSVKDLMRRYGAWMSVTIYPSNGYGYNTIGIINTMDNRGYYSTAVYYLNH